jgi:hypothetical protein
VKFNVTVSYTCVCITSIILKKETPPPNNSLFRQFLNLQVSDIKRANGLLSESAMYARDFLLIPTKPLPLRPEYSTWAGMIVTHYGRVTPPDLRHLGDMPYQQMASQQHHASIDALRGYYSTGPSPTNQSDDDDDDDDDLNDGTMRLLGKLGGGGGRKHRHNHSWQNLSEVELMTRISNGHFTTNGAANNNDRIYNSSLSGLPPEGFALPDRKPLFKAPSATDPVKTTTSNSTLIGGGDGGNSSSKWKDKLAQSFKTAGPKIAGAANALVAGGGGGIRSSSSRRQVVSSNSSKAWSDRKID